MGDNRRGGYNDLHFKISSYVFGNFAATLNMIDEKNINKIIRTNIMNKAKQYVFPRTTLSNGLVVVNFSSPHAFKFEDGSTLEACNTEHSTTLSLKEDNIETHSKCGRFMKLEKILSTPPNGFWKTIEATPECDVILVSYPLLLWAKKISL